MSTGQIDKVDVIETVNPADDEVIESYQRHDEAAIESTLEASVAAFRAWRNSPWTERAALLTGLAAELRNSRDRLAALMTTEMGKPITEAEAEVDKCAWVCEFYAEHGENYLAPERLTNVDARSAFVHFRPLGPVFAVMPWNYPLWQLMRCAVPIISAGNSLILKHATNVTGSALEIERLFARASAPAGLMQTLVISGSRAERLIEDDRIAAVTLTGSDAAGAAVGGAAGRAVKPAVLELGGSDPFIVLGDADLERAAEVGVKARFQNTGQSCIAAKRFIVVDAVAERFTELFTERAAELNQAPPDQPDSRLGPLARTDLRDELHGLVEAAIAGGATLRTGGERPERPGAWYSPTVLTDLPPDSPVLTEETFGPVAAIVAVPGAEEAIALANRSRYGLGSAIWTRDESKARELAARLETGMVFVNSMTASAPGIPFGGVKKSGHGRELGGAFGMRDFLNAQSVVI